MEFILRIKEEDPRIWKAMQHLTDALFHVEQSTLTREQKELIMHAIGEAALRLHEASKERNVCSR